MRNPLCSLMAHISRFTFHVLLLVGAIGCLQALASSEMAPIPAGSFRMGSDNGRPDETPVHQVSLEAFYIDKYETTNADYRAFVLANPRWQKSVVKARDYLRHWVGNDFPVGMDRYPVTYVTYEAAQAYCEWRGKRLPTEAEWEKAARGGQLGQLYPWGTQVDPDAANYDSRDMRSGGLKNMQRYLKPVDHFSPNGYTLYNMGGNAAEWCADSYLPRYRRDNVNQRKTCLQRDRLLFVVGVGLIRYSICGVPRALMPYRERITISGFGVPNPRINGDRARSLFVCAQPSYVLKCTKYQFMVL